MIMSTDEKLAILKISLIPGIGPRTFLEIIQKCTAIEFLQNPRYHFPKLKYKDFDINEKIILLEKLGIQYLVYGEENYPKLLANIYDPPIVIYYKGSLDIKTLNTAKIFAIVGSRNLDIYGQKVTKEFSIEIANSGFIIVSGMAFGADYIAHYNALEQGKPTIAILASPVDNPTPVGNTALYEKILKNGLIISEYFPGTKVSPGNFPFRNRLVAGLSIGTLVTEARLDSGSLITPTLAQNYGREVFAIPSDIYNKNAEGSNNLIRQNIAKPVFTIQDILDNFDLGTNISKKTIDLSVLSKIEKDIYDYLEQHSHDMDELVINFAEIYSQTEIIVSLSNLEICGYIKFTSGSYSIV